MVTSCGLSPAPKTGPYQLTHTSAAWPSLPQPLPACYFKPQTFEWLSGIAINTSPHFSPDLLGWCCMWKIHNKYFTNLTSIHCLLSPTACKEQGVQCGPDRLRACCHGAHTAGAEFHSSRGTEPQAVCSTSLDKVHAHVGTLRGTTVASHISGKTMNSLVCDMGKRNFPRDKK